MSKALYSAIAVVGIAAASAGAWWLMSKPTAPREIGVAGGAAAAPGPGTPSAGGAPAGAAGAAGGPARPVGVEVAKVETSAVQDDAQAVGTLRSRQNVMLRPEVAGRVVQINFNDGGAVRRGQVLVKLDDSLQRAELQQAEAQASIARANYKRNQDLVAQNFVAQRVLDESLAALQVAEAQVSLAKARLARMAVLAPFDGKVGIRSVNLGDYVKDGADLVNVEDISSLFVDFRLPERFLGKLRVGQDVELMLDAFPGRLHRARVQALDPLIDANGRSVNVRAVLPNSGGEPVARVAAPAATRSVQMMQTRAPREAAEGGGPLRPGMFARVTAVFGAKDNALMVPEEAVMPQAGRQYVYRLVSPTQLPPEARAKLPPEAQLVSQRQEVKLGIRRGGRVEIVDGVGAGDTVVVAGQQRLQRDGTPVRVVETSRPERGAGGGASGAQPAPGAAGSAPVPGASKPAAAG